MKQKFVSSHSLPIRAIRRIQREKYTVFHGNPKWVDFPTTIQLDTHNSCNLECIYCNPQGSYNIPKGKMPFEMIEYILKYFEGFEVDTFAPFLNGDGLLEERLPKITFLAKKYIPYTRVEVFTNGAAYENRHLLIDENLDTVRFTISAVSRETYEHVHGKPIYDRVMKTFNWFVDHKLPHQKLIVNFVLTGHNFTELESWKEHFRDYNQDIRPLHYGLGQESSLRSKGELSFKDTLKMADMDLKFSDDRPCMCFHNLSVSWRGEILQCPIVSYDYNYGSVGEVDFLDVWKKRFENGLDYSYCKSCVWKDPDWRDIFKKYS